jgi:hypothetical protein
MRRKVYALANESSWIKNSGIVMSQTSYFLSAKSSPERITNRIVASLDFFETPEELGKVISGFFEMLCIVQTKNAQGLQLIFHKKAD